jgi:hypothetical protein
MLVGVVGGVKDVLSAVLPKPSARVTPTRQNREDAPVRQAEKPGTQKRKKKNSAR